MTPPSATSPLAGEPVAYWTGLAYEAIIAFIRRRQAELGFTSPSSGCSATSPRTTSPPTATP